MKKQLDKLAEDIKQLPSERLDQLKKLIEGGDKLLVDIQEAAILLTVSVDTIRRAIKANSIRAFQLNKRGNWKIPVKEIERFWKGGKK